MESPTEKLGYWLYDQQLRAEQRAVLVCLCHASLDRLSRASSFPIGELLTDVTAQMLANRVYQHALDHAAAFQGMPQTYAVELWWPQEGVAGASHMMRVLGAVAPAGMMTEPASERGALAQTMRHLEAREKLTAHVLQGAFGTMATTIDRLSQRTEQLERERVNFFDVYERARANVHTRELEQLRETRTQDRIDGAAQSLKLIAGPIVKGVLVKAGLGAGVENAATDAISAEWLRSLSRDQFNAILASSTDAQRIALLTAYKTLVLDHEPDEPQPPPNGSQH